MQSYNKYLQEFLQSVCQEVRFKSIHQSIAKELSDHIEDQRQEYMSRGMDEESAARKAIEEMGDPAVVGKQLNQTHKPRVEWTILITSGVLVILGGIIQYFISGASESTLHMFPRFLLYAPIGIAAFAFMYFFDYTLLGRYSRLAYFILIAVTALGFTVFGQINGGYRHVYYAALLFIPIFAGIVYSYRNKGYLGIILCGIFYGGAALLSILAPSLTTLLLLSISCLIILTKAILRNHFGCNSKVGLAIVYIPVLVLSIFMLLTLPTYMHQRIAVMINPELDPRGSGYHSFVVRNLISSSKPIGPATLPEDFIHLISPSRPIGPATLPEDFTNMSIERILPSWSTDLSLTYIIAKLGYIAGIIIISIMLILICRMFASVSKQRNSYGFLVALSACIALVMQIVFYILSNLGIFIPFYSVLTLPFITYGAYGFIVNMALMGLLLSVYRRTDIVCNSPKSNTTHRPLISLQDGKLIIDLQLRTGDSMNAGKLKRQ